MKLAIDIGNTLAKAAFFSEKGMSEVLVFDLNQTESLIEWLEKVSFSGVGMIASVKPVPENLLNELASRIKISVLDHSTSLPFKITYDTPETLGRDRIAGVAAAFGAFPNQNVLIIDMGTCITYDILTAEGDYQGGAISPGINMRFAAMEAFTSKLPLANPILSAPLVGKSTIGSLQSGVMNGVQAEIMATIAQYETIYKELTVILGGGDNKYFDKKFKSNIFAAPNIVLEGLKIIMDFNEIE